MQIVLQPCGDSDAREHFVDTIENPVSIARIVPHLSPDDAALVSSTFGSAVAVWGVTPGVNDVNRRKWERMAVGDMALLYRKGGFFFRGTVAFKTHSRDLALSLWATNRKGETWECVFFLTDIQAISVPIASFNRLAGYSPNAIVQGFNVLDEERSAIIADGLEFRQALTPVVVSPNERASIVNQLNALSATDVLSSATRRQEQGLLRKLLLGTRRSIECPICGRDLPIDVVVIGHIKRRCDCSDLERRNLRNVMPVCLLGCDRLFEKGYIFVGSDGRIQRTTRLSVPPALAEVVDALAGRHCSSWDADAEAFFAWHRNSHSKFAS